MNQVSNDDDDDDDDDDDGCIRLGKAKKSGFYDPFSNLIFLFWWWGGGGGGGGEFKSGYSNPRIRFSEGFCRLIQNWIS